MNQQDLEYYWYWFVNIYGLGNRSRLQLIELYGHPSRIYELTEKELNDLSERGILNKKQLASFIHSRQYESLTQGILRLKEEGVRFIHWESEDYPSPFRNLYDPPYGFYLRGSLPDFRKPSVAIVGSRKASPYGRKIAEWFSGELAAKGVSIISGMAAGIDAVAHRSALEREGVTLGILGGGIDTMYPKSNWPLYLDMYQHGGILSEFNLGVVNKAGLFPMRNRLISGLADIVLVVEAGCRSGSLITADQAIEQGKEVYAVPGRLTDPMSQGCNHLIAQGAAIAENPEEILSELQQRYSGFLTGENAGIEEQTDSYRNFTEKEKIVVQNLDLNQAISFEKLMILTGFSLDQLQEILAELELNGQIEQVQQNMYRKNN